MAGYSPDLTLDQKVEVLETARRRGAAAPGPRLGPRHPGRPDPARADQDRRRGGHGEDPARVPAAPPARRHPQGARASSAATTRTDPDDYRATDRRARTCPSTCARRSSARSTSSSAPASRAPSTGGSAPGSTPCSRSPGASESEDRLDIAEASRILDEDHDGLRRREGAHPRAPGRAQAAGRARPGPGRRPRRGRHPGPRRPPGRRQDVARRVGGHAPSGASSSASPWAACATRPRSAATAAPTSAPSRAAWSAPCARRGP